MGLFKSLLAMMVMHRYLPGATFSGILGQLFSNEMFFYSVGALGVVEFLIDLVPKWDTQWHKWNGHLRIIGGAVISWAILSQEETSAKIMMAIVGFALALTSYTATTSARRAAVRAGTGGFVSPISSVTEDCLIATTLVPLVRLPPMTLLLVAFMLMAAMLVIYVIRKEAHETYQWIFRGRWVNPEITDTSGQHSG